MQYLNHLAAAFAATALASPSVWAAWPDRHGPTLDGHVAMADANRLPRKWTASKNVAWKAPLHGSGHSSPVVGGGKVWLTAATEDGKKQFVIGINEQTGDVLHDILLWTNDTVEPLGGAVGFNNYAAPSCTLDDGGVYVHFGSYGTAKLDAVTGEVLWQRRDFPCRHFRGPGSSPLLVDGVLVLTFDGIDQQYTVALDAATGKKLWRTDRSTHYDDLDDTGQPVREGDLRKAYCTPGTATVNGSKQVLSVGSRAMQSYDLQSGEELWTVRHGQYNAAVRPLWLPEKKLVILNTGSRQSRLMAIRLDGTTKGDVTDSHLVWSVDKGNPRFSIPIHHAGRLYQNSDNGVLVCLDVNTGDLLWKGRIRGDYRASPILVGDALYFISEEGRATIVATGDAFNEIAVNEVDEMGTTSCPAVSSGALFIRGKSHLFKISNASKPASE